MIEVPVWLVALVASVFAFALCGYRATSEYTSGVDASLWAVGGVVLFFLVWMLYGAYSLGAS